MDIGEPEEVKRGNKSKTSRDFILVSNRSYSEVFEKYSV